MKKFKQLLSIFYILTVFLTFGCIDGEKSKIYDDDARIAKRVDINFFIGKFEIGKGNEQIYIKFGSFTGKLTLWKISAQTDCEISAEILMNCDRGRLKICLIDAGNEVETIAEGTTEDTITIQLKAGTNYISLVGNDAKGLIDIKVLADGANVNIKKEA